MSITTLIGCGSEEKNYISEHVCVECKNKASHYMGKKSVNYLTIDLYYCDLCYDKVVNEAKENNRIAYEAW